jgi:O-methyltransferase involved in polyketide biosynthesis
MTDPTSSVRSISDTARWVAYFRARETERPDALFRDPFAERLAGVHGFQIANSLPDGNKHEWARTARTYLFDHFFSRAIQDGADLVVNLAAGLDARPYRMDLPSTLHRSKLIFLTSFRTKKKSSRMKNRAADLSESR